MQENDNNKIKETFPEEYQQHRKKMMRSYLQLGILVLFCTVFFWIGFNRGKISQNEDAPLQLQKTVFTNKEKSDNNTIDFSLFWKVWDLLKDKYVDVKSLDANNLYYGAIKGMVEATNDPYTTFFTAEENKRFNEDITGNFEGIGAELGIKNGILTIIAPLQGTPSEKAGLRSGDKIIKIDDKNSADMMIEEAVNSIRGPKGSSVKLTIFREGENDTRDVTVERDVINVKSVSIDWKENNIAYIEITRFGDDTLRGFASAILQVRTRKSNGLIIDLRNNPGGYLDTSIDLASMLLPKGKVVVIEETRDKNQKNMYTSGGDMASGIETVVLINEGSASASEILAGALRDNRDNVTILGKKSFGKGSVQEFIELPQNNAVKITVGRWLTPKGVQINEQGIMPDKEVNLTNDDYNNNRDPQIEAAIATLKEKLNLK